MHAAGLAARALEQRYRCRRRCSAGRGEQFGPARRRSHLPQLPFKPACAPSRAPCHSLESYVPCSPNSCVDDRLDRCLVICKICARAYRVPRVCCIVLTGAPNTVQAAADVQARWTCAQGLAVRYREGRWVQAPACRTRSGGRVPSLQLIRSARAAVASSDLSYRSAAPIRLQGTASSGHMCTMRCALTCSPGEPAPADRASARVQKRSLGSCGHGFVDAQMHGVASGSFSHPHRLRASTTLTAPKSGRCGAQRQ